MHHKGVAMFAAKSFVNDALKKKKKKDLINACARELIKRKQVNRESV